MKKIIRTFAFAAVAAAAITACNKEIDIATTVEEHDFVYTFAIGHDAAMTKAVLASDATGKFAQWESGDRLGSITTKTSGYSNITPANGDTPATFSIYSQGGLSEGNTITVWYPYGGSTQSNATAVNLEIPEEQHHLSDGKFDFDAMPMVAKQITVTSEMESNTTTTTLATINFANIGSVLNFKIFSTDATYVNEKVNKVIFNAKNADGSADANIGGTFTKNLSTVDPADEETLSIGSFTAGVSSIVTKPYADAAIGSNKGTALDLFMVVAPGEYTGTVVVRTDAAEYSFPISTAKTFVRSGIKAFGLDLNSPNVTRVAAAPEVEIYSTEFNYLISGTNYAGSDPIIGTDAGSTTSWSIVYGNWNSSNCAQLRVYKEGNFGSIYNNFDCSYVTSVSYSAKVSNTALKLNTYYSTDSGANWVAVDVNKALTTSEASYSFTVSATGEYERVRIKFEVTGTKPSSSSYSLTIDDVVINGYGSVLLEPVISLSATTITLPYQGTAQSIDVTSNYEWLADFVQNESYTVNVAPDTGNDSNAYGNVTAVSISAPANSVNSEITLGTINFYDYATSELKASCTVKQEARPANGVSVDNNTPQLASGISKTVTVNVTCNWAWEAVLTSGSGFSFTPASGDGNGSITITSTVASGAAGVITLTDKDDNTSTCTITVSQATAGTLSAGTVLWTDTFGDYGGTGSTFTDQYLLSGYTYTGRSGYSDNTDVTLTASNDNVRATTSTGTNCTSGHLWFNKSQEASVTTSSIRLYGATSLVLTYDQGTSGSSITPSYSVDGGKNWTNLSSSGPAANITREFTVDGGTTSILIRFTHPSTNSKNTRFDNPTLSVGN